MTAPRCWCGLTHPPLSLTERVTETAAQLLSSVVSALFAPVGWLVRRELAARDEARAAASPGVPAAPIGPVTS